MYLYIHFRTKLTRRTSRMKTSPWLNLKEILMVDAHVKEIVRGEIVDVRNVVWCVPKIVNVPKKCVSIINTCHCYIIGK